MSYSCADFQEDVFGAFQIAGLIKEYAPESPEETATLVIDALETLVEQRAALVAALERLQLAVYGDPDHAEGLPFHYRGAMEQARALLHALNVNSKETE